ncbi:Amino acid adenylation [Xenorhabdus stockiae]|uniref:Amino acid adenylation n=1 Tax=Xenorhabdus stockiae TaxID=351614 RepID=A0A2D0KX46_9GAMM|nr:non-ribosomal peptide synthetase [Xenorhabdus stockiae]PHM67787.1 Amino acid adenylation [Xenorhabdus stockiae]
MPYNHNRTSESSLAITSSDLISYPLSSPQQAIWFDQVSQPDQSNYNVGIFICIEGVLDETQFIHAFETVVEQYDALRLQLTNTHTLPVQTVADHCPVSVPIYDFSSHPDAETKARQYLDTRFMQPFHLNETLWHSELFKVSHTRRYWQFCCHHIIIDGIGAFILLEEVIDRYNRLMKGEPLNKVAPSYLDFITDDLAYLASPNYADDLQFWLERYENPPSPLLHPMKSNRTMQYGMQHSQTEPIFWLIDQTLFNRIKNIATEQKSSFLYIIHSALVCYFARTTDVNEIVIGMPIHNRKNTRQKHTIGLFASVLPIKVTISPEDTFRDIMNKTAAEVKSCYKHHRFPIADLNRHIHTQQKTEITQLFDITLSLEPFEANLHLEGEDTRVTCVNTQNRNPYPLSVRIKQFIDTAAPEDTFQSATIEFKYSGEYLTATEVTALRSRLAVLLDAALTSPDTPIINLPILPEEERKKVLVDFNATQSDFPQTALIQTLFEQQVILAPEAIAVVGETQTFSYNELNQRANQLAHALIALGVQPDDRVAVCIERSPAFIVCLLGILKAGGAYVPLDPAYPTERLADILDDAVPVVLLTQAAQRDKLPDTVPVYTLDASGTLEAAPELPTHNPNAQAWGLTSRHLAYVIYTSGSTGQPKGVMVEHRNVNHLVINSSYADIGADDCVAHCANIAFDASTWEIWTPLLNGGRLYVIAQSVLLNPEHFRDTLICGKVTALWLTTGLFNAYRETLMPLFGQLRYLLVGGDVLDPGKIQRVQLAECRPAHLINGYGPTETTTFATTYAITSPVDVVCPIPIGCPIANTQIYILDSHRRLVPLGVTGEIYIGGAGVARGYLNRPDLTAENFLPNPFSTEPNDRLYKTGDLGRWLPDGNIDYLGRNDFQVKLRGFRIEPGEIEASLMRCEGVREAVVMLRDNASDDNESSQKQLVAYLLAQDGAELIPAELYAQLSQRLADYMLPGAFIILQSFPLTPNGKLDRRALPGPDPAAIITRDYVAPVGEVETTLADIWQDLLGLERVGRHDHFFRLGGHSLIAVSLIEQLRSQGYALDVFSIFTAPLLMDMAQAIQVRRGASDNLIPPNGIPDDCTAITPDMLPLVTLSQNEIDTIVATVTGGAANVQDIYPLSPLQAGILFHHQMQENGDAYVLSSLLAFDSGERREAFLQALQQVIDRHDILRTAFCWQELTQPVQVVWRQATLKINTFTAPDNEQDVSSQLRAHTDPHQRCLNLNQAPLFSADIAYNSHKNEWLLSLCFHHLVCDHTTLGLIIAEIRELLSVRGKEHHSLTLPPAQPYRNFIAQIRTVPIEKHRDYFHQLLGDVDEPTLPFNLRNVWGNHEGLNKIEEARLTLDDQLTHQLRDCTRQQGVSTAVLFHIAWAQVLAQCSGREDVIFGTVLLGRSLQGAGVSQVLGMFINTLPVRIMLQERTVQKVVQETHLQLSKLLEHEQTPLTIAQYCSGIQAPHPLFNSLLNFRHSPRSNQLTESPVWEGIQIFNSEERSNYPLSLDVDDFEDGFALTAQCNHQINPARINAYMNTALKTLVTTLQNMPQQNIQSLSILPPAERSQLLEEFNSARIDCPQDMLLQQLFEQQATLTPDVIALIHAEPMNREVQLTYRELNQKANQLAHALIDAGVRPDDRVVICVERGVDMVIGLLGILKAGAGYVPLDTNYPTELLNYILSDCTPTLLLTQQHLKTRLSADMPIWVLDDNSHTECMAQQPTHNPDSQQLGLAPHHLAYIIYTSGSTGQPKGVMIEHHNVVNFIHVQRQINELTPTDRVLQFTSVAFDTSVSDIFATLATGATLVMCPSVLRVPDNTFARFLQQQQITVADLPTAFWHLWVQEMVAGRCGFSPSLRLVIVGGEKAELRHLMIWQTLPETQSCHWINSYGPTETTVIATVLKVDRHSAYTGETLPIGYPIANTQIYILDNHGKPVPMGVMGELYIGGSGVARGYLNRPELTAERFLPDPFSTETKARLYKTGDLGRWLPDGNIEYLGRNDFQIKLRGFRIEPGEIEAKLTRYPGVREAVVVAREDQHGDKRLVAYLIPEQGIAEPEAKLIPADLRQQLSQELADYMLPSAFVILDAFPLTVNGKLNLQALPAPDQTAVITHNYEAPMDALETTLAEIWQTLLGLDRVGRYDNFFELGGHSLNATQLLARMHQQGMEIPLTTLFTCPTLCELAIAVRKQTITPAFSRNINPVPLSPEGSLPPLFFVHELTGNPLVYSSLAALLPPELPIYALQALGIHTLAEPPISINALAACHIQAIRHVQTHGPYRLAGWSLGGVIAYEIAMQLMHDGEEVTFLGMIDSGNISRYSTQPDKLMNTTQQRINRIIKYLQISIPEINDHTLEVLYQFNDVEQIVNHCIDCQWLPTYYTRENLFLHIGTIEFLDQLSTDYIPQASELPIHLYKAENFIIDGDEWHGWQGVVANSSTLHPIGGTHYSIMRHPLVNQLADSVSRILEPRKPQ